MTQNNDYTQCYLKGRHPEQARMSKGIGGSAVDKVAEGFMSDELFHEIFLGTEGDVPSVIKTDGQLRPLGRYLKSRFRKNLGWSDTNLPKEKYEAWKEEMRTLYEENFPGSTHKTSDQTKKVLIQDLNRDAITNIESKFQKYNLTGAL